MKNLFLCTGVRSFAFFSRSHAEDSTTTFTATSDSTVMKFFPEVLKLDYADVLAKFEMYACLESRGEFPTYLFMNCALTVNGRCDKARYAAFNAR